MTLAEIREFHRSHWRRPWVWAIVIALGISDYLGTGSILFPPRFHSLWRLVGYLSVVLLANGSTVWLGPWPWLWTGRSGAYPSHGRGIAQSVIFSLICFLPVSLLLVATQASTSTSSGVSLPTWMYLRYVVFFYASLFCLLGFGIVTYGREVEARHEAEKRAKEAQWILLKGHMNPHVFFNAMNNLTELILKDPPLAERAAMDLRDLFRRLLEHGQRRVTPLREERLLVEHYLGIEALRLGARLRVTWAWAPALDEIIAPPLLVQPLVENAIKHGLAPHPEGGELRISAGMTDDQIRIRVENTGRSLGLRQSGGSGLDNLEARLRLAFEEKASFHLVSEGAWTLAELRFPGPPAAAPGQ